MLIDILDEKEQYHKGGTNPYHKIDLLDLELFHIQEITFEEESPRREALENVLGSLRLEGFNFVYLILGDEQGISFYFGVVKNRKNTIIDADDVAKQILKSNIEGNFRGSKIERIEKKEKEKIRENLKEFTYISEVSGVPDVNEEAEKFQGVDRLVDIMSNDRFAILVLASSISLEEIKNIEKKLYHIYDKLSPLAKKSVQKTESNSSIKSNSINLSETESSSISKTDTETDTKTKTKTTSSTNENSKEINSKESKSLSKTESDAKSETETTNASKTETQNKSTTKSENSTKTANITENTTINMEFAKKNLEEWLKYIDEVLLKRINYSKGKGAFKSGIYLFANTKGKMTKLGNSFVSLFSGVKENKLPLQYQEVKKELKEIIYNFQIPEYNLKLNETEKEKMILHSLINGTEWFSTRELSIIASLPQKEVAGLRLKEEVEFGLNVPTLEDGIKLGKIIRSGQEINKDVILSYNEINKHIFITGVTGSGKTTTCHKILYESNMPFLVIEPAKTEYRILAQNDDILVFSFGNENLAPFRLNPFEFYEGENISSRVDMIKASIENAFDMEAAIPQIIETAIYRAYEKYGWDIATSKNYKIKNPFEKGVKSFPMLEDVIKITEEVVKEQGFDERLKNDYLGSIKARLQGLIVGNKKFTLNTPRGFDFRELLYKKVIFELEEIKNPNEKSFILGLILINLNEAIKSIHKKDKTFKHITLLEEAHRVLSRYEAGDSLNKKSGVEAFSDMLAEVRKYGESLIIIDQIPNKLTPEVLKNTNTKIVHRIFAQDDKEVIGNTMALNSEQKEFLSKLDVGKAIIFNQSYYNSIQVKISQLENVSTTGVNEVSEEFLRNRWLEFYKKESSINLSLKEIDELLKSNFINLFENFKNDASNEIIRKKLQNVLQNISIDIKILSKFVVDRFYKAKPYQEIEELLKLLKETINIGGKMKNLYEKEKV